MLHGCLQASGILVLYLRDINMPKADKYGTSQVMAFLQQLLTYQGFYNDKLEFIGEHLSFVLAAGALLHEQAAANFCCIQHVKVVAPP